MVAFCREIHPKLLGALALHTGNRWVAEELAQETLVRVCQHWRRVSEMASPRAWTHRVGLNLANSWLRRRGAQRRADARLQAREAVPASRTDEAAAMALRAAIRRLPTRQRTALVLRYYADLSGAQAATAMGCAEGTVRALTHQAITSLRSQGGLRNLEVEDAF